MTDQRRPARPNLLLVMADQHAAHALSCAGSGYVATPAIDTLAAEGTHFTRAYTTFPLCVPARASMMTGRHPHQLGVRGNRSIDARLCWAPTSLGHALRGAGYDTAYGGKWHAPQPSVSAEDGFEVVAPFGDRGLVDAACSWLRGRPRQSEPFALVVSFDDPHTICEYARSQPMPYGEITEVPTVRELPALPANHGPSAYQPEAVRHEQQRAAASYGTAGFGPDEWRRYRHVYARLVERADAAVGAVLRALRSAGHAEDTVVIYTSDHGDGDAAHGWNQKTALFEECCRVPLIVRDPARRFLGASSDALVSVGLDLLPTARAVAGLPPDPVCAGRDLFAVAAGSTRHEEIVIETTFEKPLGAGTTGRALIEQRFKYVVYGWGAHREQLFDLTNDPGEMRNLAAEAAFDPVLERMRTRLLAWCRRTNDTEFLTRLRLPAGVDPEVRDEIFAVPY